MFHQLSSREQKELCDRWWQIRKTVTIEIIGYVIFLLFRLLLFSTTLFNFLFGLFPKAFNNSILIVRIWGQEQSENQKYNSIIIVSKCICSFLPLWLSIYWKLGILLMELQTEKCVMQLHKLGKHLLQSEF